MRTEHGKNKEHTVYKCESCEFRTIEEQIYLIHANSKHLECEKCGFKTITLDLMNLHKTTNHKLNMRKRKFVLIVNKE